MAVRIAVAVHKLTDRGREMKRLDVLATIQWAENNFGSLTTNRQCTRRDVMKCIADGLVVSAGDVALCDEDGAIVQPERYREGFKLTEVGKAMLATTINTWAANALAEKK